MNSVGRCLARRAIILGGALVAPLLGGCTELSSGTDRAPLEAGTGPDPLWDCLDPANAPTVTAPSPPPTYVAYVVPIFDLVQPPKPVPHLKVQACQVLDVDCKDPLPDTSYSEMDVLQPGSTIPIPTYIIVFPYTPVITFYLRLTTPQPSDPTKYPDYLPLDYYFEGPLVKADGDPLPNGIPTIRGRPILVLSAADADTFAMDLKVTRDKTAALIALRAVDCTGDTAENVTLGLEENVGVPFTFKSSLPYSPSTGRGVATDTLPTDKSGNAGFGNIPLPLPMSDSLAPTVNIVGMNPAGKPFGGIGVTIRPGHITAGEIRPYPDLFGR